MHPCKKCFLRHESKDNDLCFHCDARIQACQGVYIEPPPKQHVAHQIPGKIYGQTDRKFMKITEILGYISERVMWNDLYWAKNLSYAKIREYITVKTLITMSNSMIGERFIRLGIPRRKPGGPKLKPGKGRIVEASVARRIG